MLKPTSQSGFTIIESLMAIMVAGILLTALSPLVVIYVGSRVQARRVDQATQAARSYIDGLRSGSLTPPKVSGSINFSKSDLGVPAPTDLPDLGDYPGTCLDANLNSLGSTDCKAKAFLVIQALRDGPANTVKPDDPSGPQKQGYCLAVRVYRADAFSASTTLKTEQVPNIFTGTLGKKEYPLVVMKTEIINQTSFENYQKRFKDGKQNSCKVS